jgi:hypothetical protein
MFALGEEPRFVFTMDIEIITVIEFPQVRSPAVVNISAKKKGILHGLGLPKMSQLVVEDIQVQLQ